MTNLDDRLVQLAQSRKNVGIQKTIIAKYEADLTETEAYSALQTAKKALTQFQEDVKEYDTRVRDIALSYHTSTESKSINDFVSIAEYATFEIDEPIAIAWAAEHHQGALKLDKSAIKKVAKVMPVDGIVVGEEFKVRIATDLSKLLEE